MTTQDLCRCGKRQKAPDRSRCDQCLEKARQYTRKKHKRDYQQRIAAGLCVRCGNQSPVTGKRSCQGCLDREVKYTAKRRERKLQQGLCTQCGKAPLVEGSQLCKTCREATSKKARGYYDKLDRLKSCLRCRKPLDVPGFASCSKCRQQQKEYVLKKYRERAKAGLCTDCGIPREQNSPSGHLCVSCWQKSASRRKKSHSKTHFDGQLENIIARDGGCIACDRPYGTRKNSVVCHHIDGNTSNNDPSNLVLLCRKCHSVAEGWKYLDKSQRGKMLTFLLQHYPCQ